MDPTHIFTLSQVYEGLLLKMGEKGNDGQRDDDANAAGGVADRLAQKLGQWRPFQRSQCFRSLVYPEPEAAPRLT